MVLGPDSVHNALAGVAASVQPVPRLAALLFAALSLAATACGESDEAENLLTEDSLRECLADAGLSANAPRGDTGGYAPLTNAPDFVLYAGDGTSVSVTVYGSVAKAERAAADLRAAIQSVGDVDEREVLAGRNVVVTFGKAPPGAARSAVGGCLE